MPKIRTFKQAIRALKKLAGDRSCNVQRDIWGWDEDASTYKMYIAGYGPDNFDCIREVSVDSWDECISKVKAELVKTKRGVA